MFAVNRHRYIALVLVVAFSFSFAFDGLLAFGNLGAIGNNGGSSGNTFNKTTGTTTPVASDTKNPSHNWKGIVSLNTWWNTAWTYRQMVNFTEPGLMDRLNDPENVYMTFSGNVAHNNSIRVACFVNTNSSWLEIPSQVWNATFSGAFYTRCTIFFFLNLTKSTTETYYIYYDPAINTKTTYVNHIYLRGYTDAAIPADTTNPSFTSFYYNNATKPAYNLVNSIQIIVNNNTATPRAKVCLVPTVRGGSDWGGSCMSIYSALQAGTDTLNAANKAFESVGTLALQAANDTTTDGSGALQWERVNVAPNNPAEAWDGHGSITVIANGPLFCQFKVRTTDGGYNDAVVLGTTWVNGGYDDVWNASVHTDAVNMGNDGYTSPTGTQVCNVGGIGYVKYNLTYTFYYQQATPSQLFARLDMTIGAFPQRGPAASGYPVSNARYTYRTGVCFKNFGDWPHIMQIVATNTTNLAQNSKSWNGSKYGLYTMNLASRKCDYPLEPWTCWWDSNNVAPTLGMMAITNSIGWQVLSLAVAGIGPNSLLQQILPEGLQGGLYQIPNNVIMPYTYYTMTAPAGQNYTTVRDMTRRLNKPASISAFGAAETYVKNQMWVHTTDISSNLALGVQVTVKYSGNSTIFGSKTVNSTGWAAFLQIPDNTYIVQVTMATNNLKTQYTVYSQSYTLIHTTRYYYINAMCNMANLTLKVVNSAKSNQLLTAVLVKFVNVTGWATMDQNYTYNGYGSFRLYTTGATRYSIQMFYGGVNDTVNFTNPYTLNVDKTLNVGLAINTTAITMNSQPASVTFGGNYTVSFYFNNYGDLTSKFRPSSVTVSNLIGSGYWPGGMGGMFNWSIGGGNLVSLTLATGLTRWLNTTGTLPVFIHAFNSSVIPATQQIYIVINSIPTTIKFTLNNTVSNSISVSRGNQVLLKVAYLNGVTPIQVATASNVNYTLNSATTTIPWNAGNNNYTATIPTLSLASGTYVVTVSAFQPNYAKAVTSFVIIVSLRPATLSPSSPGIIYYGTTFNIPFTLTDGVNGTGISTISSRLDANVKNYPGINELSITGTAGNYQVNYNSTSFPVLGSYFIYINWTAPVLYPYYQNCYSSITITISQRLSQLTYSPVGNVAFGENVPVSVNFADGVNGTGISNTHVTVGCNVTGFSQVYQGSGNYLVTFSTRTLGALGTFYANISLAYNQLFVPYYKNQWVNVKIVVINRPTQLVATSPAATQYNQVASFTLTYSDLLNSTVLSGAKVSISSIANTTVIVTPSGNQYVATVNTNQFAGAGTYTFTMRANWTKSSQPYYNNNTVVVKLTVTQRSSQVSYDSLSPTAFQNNFTFYVNFQDGVNSTGISGATISSNMTHPTHITVSMVSAGRYSLSINTTEVRIPGSVGSSFVIIFVNAPSGKPFYANGQITILFSVTKRPTTLSYSSLQPTPLFQPVSFTIKYADSVKGTGVFQNVLVSTPTAGVSLASAYQGSGNYAITLTNTGLLTIGSHAIVFNFNNTPSVSPFYADNVITITVQITARATQIVYSGLVPTSYGQPYDFTVQVQDTNGTIITGIGAGSFSSNSSTFNRYSESPAGTYHISIQTTERNQIGSVKYWINAVPGAKYANANLTITFTAVNRAVSLSPGSVPVTNFGQIVAFTVQYSDGINGTGLAGHPTYFAGNWSGDNFPSLGGGVYNVTIPANDFSAVGSYGIQITATWPGATKPFYAAATIIVSFSISQRASVLSVNKEINPQFGDNMLINVKFQDGVNGSYININKVTQLSVSVIGFNASVTMVRTGSNGNYNVSIMTDSLPAIGPYTVSFTASWAGKPFYASQTQSVSVTVTQRTDQVSYSSLAPAAYNDNFTFTINFLDGSNGNPISGASLSSNLTHPTHITWSMASAGHYSISINTTEVRIPASVGSSNVIIFVTAPSGNPFYTNNQITLLLTVTKRSTTLSYSSLQPTPLYQPVSFTIKYADSGKGTGVFQNVLVSTPTAGVSLASAYQGSGNYAITLTNTGLLTIGSHAIVFNFNNTPSVSPFYADNVITITVQITARATQIVYSGLVPTSYGQPYDFTVQVQDTNGTIITGIGAGSFSSNSSTFSRYSESPAGTYHINIQTTERNQIGSVKYWINAVPGAKYTNANLTIAFTAVNRAVSLSPGSVPVTNFGQIVAFTVQYSDGINGTGLAGHPTYLAGNWSGNNFVSLGGGSYNITIPAADFSAVGAYGVQITATWPGATKPFYATSVIVVAFSVSQRASVLTASKESNPQFGEVITIDITYQDGINGSNININKVTQLSILVSGNGVVNASLVMVRSVNAGLYKVNISTSNMPVVGTYTVTVTTSWTGKPFYYGQTQIVSVTVTKRNSILNLGNPSEVYKTYGYNVKFNVTFGYLDVINGSTITKDTAVARRVSAKDHLGANVTTITNGNTVINYSSTLGWQIHFNSANFVTPSAFAYTVIVQFNWSITTKPYYINCTISFSITMSVAQTQVAEVGSFTAQSGFNQTLAFQYINSQSGKVITGSPATVVTINSTTNGTRLISGGHVIWNGVATWNGTHYILMFNCTTLPGSLHPFKISFTKGSNYNIANFNFTLVDTALGSQLQLVSVQANRILGQSISMVVAYTYQGTSNGITGGTVVGTIANNVASAYWQKAEYSFVYLSLGNYNLTVLNTGVAAPRINTTNFYTIYVTMTSQTTSNATVNVQFQLNQIPTNITKEYFNTFDYTSNSPSFTTQITKTVNITVEYEQLFPSLQDIKTGATVYLTSSSLSSNYNFTLVGNKYSVLLPASKLGVGTAFLFAIAQKANYQQSSKTLQITVTQVSTSLSLYLNGTLRTSYQIGYGQKVNVSALFKNMVDNVNITDGAASVTLTGGSHGSTFPLTTSGNWWGIAGNLDSKLLGPPASYTMTLSASRANFTTSSAVFTIVVVQVPTTLVSLNATTFQVNWSSTFKIGLTYRDNTTAVVLSAQLTSNPNVNTSAATFTSPSYFLQYNASSFGSPQIYNLVITIVKGNYTSQSITFSININAMPTTLKTYVNNGPLSTNFVVNWGDTVSVVAKYNDVMHAKSIASASISAGTFTSAITSQTYSAGNYTLVFNSTILGVPGVYIISLTFSKANYATTITAITIQVSNPATTLLPLTTGGSPLATQITLYYGQSFVFVVKMHDNVHNVNLSLWNPTTNPVATFSVQEPVLKQAWTFTYNGLLPGIRTITVSGSKTNYTTASLVITVQINNLPTSLFSYASNSGPLSTSFSAQWGTSISITVQYKDTFNNLVINPALAVYTTTYASFVTSTVPNAQNVTFTYNASRFVPGVYTITLSGNRSYYAYASIAVTLTVSSMPTTLATYNSTTMTPSASFTATWGALVGIEIAYNQTATLNSFALIAGVITTSPTWTSTLADKGRLIAIYDTSKFTPGIYPITINAIYANRTSQSTAVSLAINAVPTQIFAYNSSNKIATTYNVYWNQLLSIDILYQATTLTNLTRLAGTTVTSSPLTPVSQVASLYAGRMNLTFSTSMLGIQIYQITFTATRANYTVASVSVLVNVMQRLSNVKVYNIAYVENYSYNVYWGDTLAVNVRFADGLNATSLSNLGGTTITSAPPYSSGAPNGQYMQVSFNTATYTPSLYSIVISCSRSKYASAQVVVLLNVLPVPTAIATYNASIATSSFMATWNTLFTISVQYSRTYVPAPITGALIGTNYANVSGSYSAGKYLLTFNSSRIGSPGIYSITFTASKTNFVTSTTSITLQVVLVNTVIQAYAFGGNVQSQFTVEWGSNVTFTIQYKLAASPFTKLHPTSVTKTTFPGTVALGTPANENITLTVNSTAFGGIGVFTPTFLMVRTNYTQNSILITIVVNSMNTTLSTYNHATNTPSSSFTATWGAIASFDIAYNQTGTSKSFALIVGVITTSPAWTSTAAYKGRLVANFNTALFAPGIYTVTVTAQYANRTSRSTAVTLTINVVPTQIFTFNSSNKIATTYNVYWNQQVLIDVLYQTTTLTNLTTLYRTTVTSTPLIPTSQVNSSTYAGRQTLTFSTSALAIQIYQITITATRANYTLASISVLVNVMQRTSNVHVYNMAYAENYSYNVYWGDTLAVNVLYADSLNATSLSNMAGTTISSSIASTSSNNAPYLQLSFNTATLVPNLYSIVISCSRNNYVSGQAVVLLNVINVPTTVTTYNYTTNTLSSSFKAPWNTSFNVSVQYSRTHLPASIASATVNSNPANVSGKYVGGKYVFTFNTLTIGSPGIYTITFTASKTNFVTSATSITLEILAVQTRVDLGINSTTSPSPTNITVSRQFFVPFQNNITIQVQYLMLIGGSPISSAQIMIRFLERSRNWTNYPVSNSSISIIQNKSQGEYYLTLNTTSALGDYNQYSFVVTISRANYTLQSQTFYVYPLKRTTTMRIYDSSWKLVVTGQKFTVNYTRALTIYCSLFDLSTNKPINGANYTAVMKGFTYVPNPLYVNASAAQFVFNSSLISVDVGTSNFISFSGNSGIYNPAGGAINLEVDLVPTSIKVFSASGQVNPGDTITLYYTQQFGLNVTYTDILSGKNITNLAGASVFATVYSSNVTASFMSGKWHLVFNSLTLPISAGSTPQIIIQASYTNRTVATFSFNLALLTVPTNVTLFRQYTNGTITAISDVVMQTANYTDPVVLRVYYNNMLNNSRVLNPATQALVGTHAPIPGAWNGTFFGFSTITIDTTFLSGGNTYTVVVTGYLMNYTSAEFRFNLHVNLVPAKLWATNDTKRFNNGDLLKVYYGDTLVMNFSYENLIKKQNETFAGIDIHAVVLGVSVPAFFNHGMWTIAIATGTLAGLRSGSTPQVIVTGSYPNYEQQEFDFNMQVLEIPTALVVPPAIQGVVHYTWGQSFSFAVQYSDTHNNVPVNGSMTTNYLASSISFSGTMNYTIVFNTTMIGSPGIYRITLTASKVNYAPASYTITVQIGEVPTNMNVMVNGVNWALLPEISLKQTVLITIDYSRVDNGNPIRGALVSLNFTNDLNGKHVGYSTHNSTYSGQIHFNASTGIYWVMITLDLKTFYAQPKFLIVQAYLANYSIGTSNPVLNLQPIEILTHQNLDKTNPTGLNIYNLQPGSTLTFDFQFFDNSTDSGFLNATEIQVNITAGTLNIYNEPMSYQGNGTFEFGLTLPSGYNKSYVVTLDVFSSVGNLSRQFHFQNEYTYHLYTLPAHPGPDLTWLVITLVLAMIVLAAWFILYQVRFKYPPIIRKIHDLQRSVRRGKAAAKIAAQKVSTREEGIYSEFANILNEYSFLQTRAKSMAASAKKAKAAKGYIEPKEKDNLALEFDLSTTEKVVEIKSVAPSIMPKEGPKKYVEPPATPAPVELPTMPEMPKVTPAKAGAAKPAAPKLPAAMKPGALRPPALAAMPKPVAKPVPQPGAIPSEGEGQEGLYGELVKLEQKKYKAQRSLRDLKAKKEKGILTDEEFKQYESKFEEALEKINEKISEIRRKLVNF